MSRRRSAAATVGDWLTALGAVGLFVSLFLTWSHQLPPQALSSAGGSPALQGVPRNPTAWQVYSIADVLLVSLAAALLAIALRGRSRRLGAWTLVAVAVALAFVAHADSVAPTNGVLLVNPAGVPLLNPSASTPSYVPHAATPGAGEAVALVALALAAVGLGVSVLLARR